MYPKKIVKLKGWAKSPNPWLRRAAAVSLIIPARKGLFHKEIFEIATILLLDDEDLIQKGYGWMLKAASESDQDAVFQFVMKNKATMPRTALRYAIEKMPKRLKEQAMAKNVKAAVPHLPERYAWVDDYCRSLPGCVGEYKREWDVTRYMLNGKWFLLIMQNPAKESILTLKLEPGSVCNQPGLILFGTTIPVVFFDALTPTLMLTGLGSRCLFIEGDPRQPYNTEAADYKTLPPELIETARWWTEYLPPDPETGKVGNLSHLNPSPLVVPTTDEAVGVLNALGEHADLSYSQTQDPIEQVLWTRVHEIANKLALVYACSADHENPVINGPAARWASEFTDWIVRQMMKLVKRNVADSPFAKLSLKAEELIRKHGGKIGRRELSRSLRVRPRELDEIIQKLLLEEMIEIVFCDGTGGRPKTFYRLIRET